MLIHLHGNRLSGSIPEMNLDLLDANYAFISDCGQPSDFSSPLVCKECTICCELPTRPYPYVSFSIDSAMYTHSIASCLIVCLLGNNEENCNPLKSAFPLSDIEVASYLVLQYLACFVGASCVLALAIVAREKYRDRNTLRTQVHPQSLTERDHKYALENLGEDSVYRFFLGTSKWGWSIFIATMITQIAILSIFVGGSKRDFSDSKVDMEYTWKCTRDRDECFDTSDLDWKGWLAFVVLMAAHMLKDGINGLKMIKHSGKQRLGSHFRIRLFIGGTLVTMITVFTTYVSTMYNMAIATSKFFHAMIVCACQCLSLVFFYRQY